MTSDSRKTKKELIAELESLRRTVTELQAFPNTPYHSTPSDAPLARLLFEDFVDPIIVADTSGTIIAANKTAGEFFGYGCDTLTGMHQRDLHPPEYTDGNLSSTFRKHLETPDRFIETPLLHASGEIRQASIKACAMNMDGTPLLVGIFRDVTESHRIKRKLEQTQERLRSMFSHQPCGVAVYEAVDNGADFIFKDFNAAAEKITNISRDKAVGKRLLSLFPQMNKAPLLASLARVWETGQAEDLPPFHYKDDIREGWRENHIYKLPSGEVVAIFTDVTQRMEALNAVKNSEERMYLALETVNDAVWDWNIRTGDVYYSPRWYTMLDYEPYELPQTFETWKQLLHPDDKQQVIRIIQQHLPHGEPFHLEFRMRTKDDGWRWIFARGRTVERDKNGGPQRMLGTHMDITERKQFEAALKESEEQFRALLENVDMVAVQGYNEARQVVYWNHASQVLYGYTKAEAMGRYLEDLIIPETMQDFVVQAVKGWVENGVAIPPGEIKLQRKDGSLVPVYSSHVMQENSKGTKTMYCIDVELSRIHQALDQLRQAKEEAELANKTKSEFLANMSHDIRTPLNGVIGMLQLLQTTSLDEEQDNYVLNAYNSSKRLTSLLSDILDLSRVEAGRMTLTNAPLFLEQTMHQLAELFMPTEKQSGVALSCHVHPKTTGQLSGDVTRIQQVLSNLVGNAFKFTPPGGDITVETYPLPATKPGTAKVLFSVADTGFGIPDDKLDTLFSPFVQGEQPRFECNRGAGLGLAISKGIVELMGGNMAVESEKGVGTTVYFCAVFDVPAQTARSLSASDKIDTCSLVIKGLRILLAEDEHVNSLVASRLLTKAGGDVTIVTNGKQALDALAQTDFDIILMDIQMPVMNGVEATKAIRQGNGPQAKIPIIAMTAYAMVGDKETFLDAGIDDYVAKPMEMDALCAVIARTLKAKK